METLDKYTEPLRSFLATDFHATRKKLGYTQLEMAEMLDIDLRSYTSLEHGDSLCSTRVFLRYAFLFKKDRETFLESIEALLKNVDPDLSNKQNRLEDEML